MLQSVGLQTVRRDRATEQHHKLWHQAPGAAGMSPLIPSGHLRGCKVGWPFFGQMPGKAKMCSLTPRVERDRRVTRIRFQRHQSA